MKKLAKIFMALLLLGVVVSSCEKEENAPAEFKSVEKYDFEPTKVGDTRTFKMVIANDGGQDLELKNFAMKGVSKEDFDYKIEIKRVKPKEKESIEIIFAPKTPGRKKATLVVDTNVGSYKISFLGKAEPKPAPKMVITPEKYDFGAVEIGKKATKKFVVANEGNADLVISKAEITGMNADQFSVEKSGATIAPNKKKEYTVTYQPTNMDNTTVTASLAIHTEEGASYASLSAMPLPKPVPTFESDPTSHTFKATYVGEETGKTIVIKNSGNATLKINSITLVGENADQFKLAYHTSIKELVAGGDIKFVAKLAPTDATLASAEAKIKFDTNAGEYFVDLIGKILEKKPAFESDPTFHTFEATYVGEESGKTIVIKNPGNATLKINSITLVGENADQFKLAYHTSIKELVAGGDIKFVAKLAPTDATLASAEAKIKFDTNAGEYFVDLIGKILEKKPAFESDPTSHTFEATYVGEESRETIVIKNPGNTTLKINSITLVGTNKNQFKLEHHTVIKELVAGGYTKFKVVFAPTDVTLASAEAKIKFDTNAGEYFVDLNGKILTQPELTVNPEEYDFGKVAVGKQATTTITATNTGNGELTISEIALVENTDVFTLESMSFPIKLQPNEEKTFTLTFAPTTAGKKNTTITISSNGGDAKVSITGAGKTTEKSTKIYFTQEETPFGSCGSELEVKGIKMLMTSESKQYVDGILGKECSSFAVGPKINLWPGEIQMDLTKKPPLKGIYLLGAGNNVSITVGLYDKDGKKLYTHDFEESEYRDFYNPIEVSVSYSNMKKVKYVVLFIAEGYLNYIHFQFE